tara:strand:- start:187 stop:561 length:375 start_codon:yes stop_codon:yes gene_type:complete
MSQFDTIKDNSTTVSRIGAQYNDTTKNFNGSIELLEIHNDYISPWNIIRKSLNKIVPTDLSNHAQFAGNCKNFFMFNDNPRLATGSVNASDRSGVYPGTARTGVLTGITGSAQSKDAPGWFENS